MQMDSPITRCRRGLAKDAGKKKTRKNKKKNRVIKELHHITTVDINVAGTTRPQNTCWPSLTTVEKTQ
tara:strand:+ start:520 stop:723 length:204 start_codon:yes stop_codon:yes gene_type:complete